MMTYLYHALVIFIGLHLVWYIVHERSFSKKAGAALVLIIFALRALLIQ
jgi:hypothetical protein